MTETLESLPMSVAEYKAARNRRVLEMLRDEMPILQISVQLRISRTTIYRIKAEAGALAEAS